MANEMKKLKVEASNGTFEFDVVDPVARAAGGGGSGPIPYVESLDESNLANLRDLETGTYVLYGYFVPYPGSEDAMTCDNTLASVAHLSSGSHVLVFNPLNCKVNFIEILDDGEGGYTYSAEIIDMRDLNKLSQGITMTDRTTGTSYTVYVNNGQIALEPAGE